MISSLLAQFMPYIIGAIVFVAGIFGYGIKKKSEGKAEVKNEQLQNDAKAAQDAKEDLEAIRVADNDEYLKRLRDSEQ